MRQDRMTDDRDRISRERIKSDLGHNFFVEAGAGSGKTTVLVERMAAMVEAGIPIERIAAITFTKAAAGEFYARFQQKLAESGSEKAQEALKKIDLCFLGTIDSFCQMILAEHPLEARIPSDAAVVDDEAMEGLYKREYSRLLSGWYGEELAGKAKRFADNFYCAEEVFLDGMKVLLANKNAEFQAAEVPAGTPDLYFGPEKKRMQEVLKTILARPGAVKLSAGTDREAWEMLQQKQDQILGPWDKDLFSFQKDLGKLKKLRLVPEFGDYLDLLGPGWEDFFTPHYARGKISWYEVNAERDPWLAEKVKQYCFDLAMDFLRAAKGPVAETLRQEGSLTFSDCLLYLRDLLREDAGAGGQLIRHIYDRHSYFLIDEFQDTNPLQAEIFFYLTAKEPQMEWKACVPQPGSLFIVGDPKQSIYRFQGADVASFLRVKGLFRGEVGEVLELSRNFRSTDPLCAWFNETFQALLPEDTATQSRFTPIPPGGKEGVGAGAIPAYFYTLRKAQTKDGRDDHDAEFVAGIIDQIVNDPAWVLPGREKGEAPRRVTYRDFMVIVPQKRDLRDYIGEFTRCRIPFRAEGMVAFSECPALTAFVPVMEVLADRQDGQARFQAEKLSGLGIKMDDISSVLERVRNLSPAAAMQRLAEEFRIFARTGAKDAESFFFALELLRSAETDGSVTSLKDGAAFLRALISEQSGEERRLQLEPEGNRVHIANLHKVKGLQAPIVILADPEKSSRDPKVRIDYGEDVPKGYLFSLKYGQWPNAKMDNGRFAEEMQAEKKVQADEETRLLYVAATRAQQCLIVCEDLKKDGTRSDKNPWNPLLGSIVDDFAKACGKITPPEQSEPERVSGEACYESAGPAGPDREKPLHKSYALKRPSTEVLPGVTATEEDYDPEVLEIRRQRQGLSPRILGTMIHRIMEVLVSSRNQAEEGKLLRETLQEYEAAPALYEEVLRDVIRRIRAGGYEQVNGVPADILGELLAADEVYCECPFCLEEGAEAGDPGADGGEEPEPAALWHGVMDVIYHKDGAWHILDYKTNADGSGLDEHYKEQLSAYERVFRAITGEEAQAKVYHIG